MNSAKSTQAIMLITKILSSFLLSASTNVVFRTIVLFTVFISGCTTTQPTHDIKPGYTSDIIKREALLSQLTTWQVKGKIAFINSEERKSASLFWNKNNLNQQLNLTTYLGINVLKLTSNNNVHTIEVDGETYQDNNLDNLIGSLIGLQFPTEALSYWIKAIPYNNSDVFTFNPESQLPLTLTSTYNSYDWLINYTSYQTIQYGEYLITLPNKIKITSADLTINIAINHWTI